MSMTMLKPGRASTDVGSAVLWAATAATACIAGALVVVQPIMALGLAAVPVCWLLVTSALARLIVVSLGALISFQSSSAVTPVKSVFFLCFLVAVVGAVLPDRRTVVRSSRPARHIATAAWILIVVTALSIVPALLYETRLSDWVRDGFSYLFFGGCLLLAIDYARHVSSRYITLIFLISGTLAATSFILTWIDRRSLGVAETRGLGFSSFLLTVALISFAVAKTPWPGSRRLAWSAVAGGATLGLLATATRSSVVVFVAVLIVLVAGPTSIGRRLAGVGVLAAVTVVLAALLLRTGIASDLIDTERVASRLATLSTAVLEPGSDESAIARRTQTDAAVAAFRSAPALGIGPGHTIKGSGQVGTRDGYFVDSPAAFLAKFGVAGLLALVGLAWFIRRFLIESNARRTPAGLALIAFLATTLLWSILGTPFDDKGTALAVGFLVALTIQETEERAGQPA